MALLVTLEVPWRLIIRLSRPALPWLAFHPLLLLGNQEGVRLWCVSETRGWVWAVAERCGYDEIAVGGGEGSIRVEKLCLEDVTAIYEVRA